ncbi:hypothetical protein TNCV_1591871 [Trichonephila clavipes]|nr:hypothetical protein TNCV_1591871 [Trichonephila clavipes]
MSPHFNSPQGPSRKPRSRTVTSNCSTESRSVWLLKETTLKAMKRTSGLNGYVNKQNGRIWSEANPQVYVETPLHLEKLTVWSALWAGGILLQKR